MQKIAEVLTAAERKVKRDEWTNKMFEQYEGMMALDDYYLKLVDENPETAIEFKRTFWQKRTDRGLKSKRFPREEVVEFINEFVKRNGVKMKVNNTEIKEKCIRELETKHGRHVSYRFERMLEDREQADGKSLNDAEVEELKIRFDTEIYRELLMKGGK